MLKKLVLTTALALLATGFVANRPASAGVIRTASFEAPSLNSPGIQYGPDEFGYNTNAVGPAIIPNFTFTGFSGIYKNGSAGVFADTSFGTQSAFLQSYTDANGSTGGGAFSWAINGLNVGQTYRLSFYDEASLIVPVDPFTVSAFGSTPLLFAPTTSFTLEGFDFIALTSSGTIDFVGSTIPGNFATAIDNIQIATIPEPFTLSLFGVGLVGAAAMRRRKKAEQA
jgi:hypothetical protein